MFNDNYGHSAGDLCLKRISYVVAATVRDGIDTTVRFGGEEIIVFLPEADFTQARRIAEEIRCAIKGAGIPHLALGPEAVVTASLGVATWPTDDCSADELVTQADVALYAAKRNGRDQVWPPLGSIQGTATWGRTRSVAPRVGIVG